MLEKCYSLKCFIIGYSIFFIAPFSDIFLDLFFLFVFFYKLWCLYSVVVLFGFILSVLKMELLEAGTDTVKKELTLIKYMGAGLARAPYYFFKHRNNNNV